jgi:hypothetical protein
MGSYMFYGDEACLHMWVPAELAPKVPDFQDQLGIQGGLRRVLVVRGFVFELSSQMDIRNRRRTHFEDIAPFCSHLRLSPRAADVTAEEAFEFLANLAEAAGAELYLLAPQDHEGLRLGSVDRQHPEHQGDGKPPREQIRVIPILEQPLPGELEDSDNGKQVARDL